MYQMNAENLIHEAIPDSYPDDDAESVISDAESECCAPEPPAFFNGLVRILEGNRVYDLLKKRFFLGLYPTLASQTTLEAIHRNNFDSVLGQAKKASFELYVKAVEEKNQVKANVKYGWYGGTKEDLYKIMQNGFGPQYKSNGNGIYGYGVHFAPDLFPMDCMNNSTIDGDGLRHLLLCRIIRGNSEVVHPNSKQYHPSSYEFDSGVDNLTAPSKLIVWSTHMNTHVLPEFIFSFKAPDSLTATVRPRSSVPSRELVSILSKSLPQAAAGTIDKYYKAHKERKITRQEMISHIRQIAGDELLVRAVLEYRNQKTSSSCACHWKSVQNKIDIELQYQQPFLSLFPHLNFLLCNSSKIIEI